MIGPRTRTIVIGVVTTVWAVNFIAGIAVKDYQPSESINGIFMAIVGGLFAIGARTPGDTGDPPPTPSAPPPPPPPPPPVQHSYPPDVSGEQPPPPPPPPPPSPSEGR